jgi:hypothetical protein
MARWLMEWFTISMIGIFGLGFMYIFSRIWSLIPAELAESSLSSMEMEGKIAFTLLFVIIVGCVKLFSKRD